MTAPFKRAYARLRTLTSRPSYAALGTIAGTLIAAYSLGTLIMHEVITHGASHGPSMQPTIPATLSSQILSRRHKHGKNIQVGDVIVFSSPIHLDGRSCKRVIGMPGDYVVRDPHNSATVDGAPAPGSDAERRDVAREEPLMVQVPEGHVWVVGDNMAYSRDSRFHGPVPMALIQGKTLYVGSLFNWTSFRGPQLQPALVNKATQENPRPG